MLKNFAVVLLFVLMGGAIFAEDSDRSYLSFSHSNEDLVIRKLSKNEKILSVGFKLNLPRGFGLIGDAEIFHTIGSPRVNSVEGGVIGRKKYKKEYFYYGATYIVSFGESDYQQSRKQGINLLIGGSKSFGNYLDLGAEMKILEFGKDSLTNYKLSIGLNVCPGMQFFTEYVTSEVSKRYNVGIKIFNT